MHAMSVDPAGERERLAAQVKELRSKIVRSEGAQLQSELSAVSRMYRLFSMNERELRRHFDVYESVEATLELWDATHPERFEAFLDETDRLLHNYLAAAASLADHTMRLWKKYPPQDAALTEEYRRRVDEAFKSSPLANFIQGLRNLTVHRQLPVIQGTLSLTGGENASLAAVTTLNKEALLAWDGWKGGAKKYLEEAGDSIDLEEVIAAYTASVHEFNRWFGQAWVGAHLAAFDELHKLEAEHVELLRQAWT